ncbi:MAG: putative zinc-binding metallopeptidase [Pirellulales bacterium]
MTATAGFQETNLETVPIRQLGLTIGGTPLEPLLAEFEQELVNSGIRRLKPRFYLSSEWGVPFGTIAVAIPFYLAHPQLTSLHAQRSGFVEGLSRWDILRYLRHELGHVVNYGYRLYEQDEWLHLFGRMDEPYQEEYRPEPFSRRYVQHLPGWYAQKHPDEDWAETFAVWLTPGRDWRSEYVDWPVALAKLEYCDRTIARRGDVEPLVTTAELDEDVSQMDLTLAEFYTEQNTEPEEFRHHLDAALRTIFEDYGRPEDRSTAAERVPASSILRETESQVMAEVYRWTGHFPERTQRLLRQMRRRADALKQVYPADRREQVAIALTALATALAMTRMQRGEYLP